MKDVIAAIVEELVAAINIATSFVIASTVVVVVGIVVVAVVVAVVSSLSAEHIKISKTIENFRSDWTTMASKSIF